MPIPRSIARLYEAGDAWLADCSAHPALVRAAWDQEVLAPIASGGRWLVAESPLLTALKALNSIRGEYQGPVLADPELDKAWWLVPLNAADKLADARQWQVVVQPKGWPLRCPPTGWHVDGRLWLSRPDGSGQLTDLALLAAAFRPGGARRLPSEVPR